jgi:hypothetical protein
MNREIKCNHAIASHEGHGMHYAYKTKYTTPPTKENLEEDCCGGVVLFNHCPFCGKEVRKIIQKIKN